MNSICLSGKTAVVTGGAGILCREFCMALAQNGARVAVVGRTFGNVEKVAKEICAKGGQAIAVCADVTKHESMEEAHETIMSAFGPCDILINGAGGNNPEATTDDESFSFENDNNPTIKTFFDLPEEGVTSVLDLNLLGTLVPSQVFGRDMANNGYGCIINISSMNAFRPLTRIPIYSAAKSGVTNLTQWLAVYFADAGIRVNAIAPGFFATSQNKNLLFNEDGSCTERSQKILNHTPMHRFGVPADLIGTLLYLIDDEQSRFVTGIVIPVDGGFNACCGV